MYGSERSTFAIYQQPLIRPEYVRLLAGAIRGVSTVTLRGMCAARGFAIRATMRDRSDRGLEAVLSTEA